MSTPPPVRNSLGVVFPGPIHAIIEECRQHPERGNFLSRVREYSQKIKKEAEESSREKRQRTQLPNKKFICTSCDENCFPAIKGSITLPCNNVIECTGYLMSICPDDNVDGTGWAVILLEIPNQGLVPFLSPDSMIEEKAIKAIKTKVNSETYHKKPSARKECRKNTEIISANSTAASCMGVQGNLLIDGPNNIKGRVVDNDMLAALEQGCLRKGTNAKQSFYTLDRRYESNRDHLMDIAQMIVESNDGIPKSCPAGRTGVDTIIRMGEAAIVSRLRWHRTILEAIISLDEASKLPPPSIDERLFQISIGGDPELLQIGRFLPCQHMKEHPDITIRCACGFEVKDTSLPQDEVHNILRRQCHRKR